MIKLQAIWKIAKNKNQICHTIGENLVNLTENEDVIADQHRIYLLNETVKQII